MARNPQFDIRNTLQCLNLTAWRARHEWRKNMIPLLVVLGVLVLFVLFLIGVYNGLVTYRNQYKNAFAQIDVQLKRRYDLIPNLVETAKGYIKHERETLEAVMAARAGAVSASKAAAANPGDPSAMTGLSQAEGALGGALVKMFAVAEAYPDLKANQNMMQLSEELTSTENRVAFSRQAFNDAVNSYNTKCEVFPNNIVAGMFNFTVAQWMESTESPEERKAPKVQF
jgi:LemA protein